MNDLHKSKATLWALLIAFVVVWFYMLGVRTLVPPDEGRYAEMAREMLLTGDWITTRLNGIKYFEKPPLQTWMNALTFAAFGLGEWQARLWTGLCGIGGVFFSAYAGYKVYGPRIGLYTGLILGSSLFWVASGQIDSLDMSLSGMMTIALGALLIAQRAAASAKEQRNWMLLCWVGMALAVLAKGLIGLILPGAVLVLYTFAARDWAIWSRLHLGKGLLAFLVVAAPWFVLVAIRNPEQPHFFFIHEHWDRFFLKTHHREGAWYYFFAMLIPGIVPWLGVLPQSLSGALRRSPGAFQPRMLLLVWAVFIFFFFSYSSSKLPGYILPIFPALALLLAVYLDGAGRRQHMLAAATITLIGVLGFLMAPSMTSMSTRYPSELILLQDYETWVLTAALVAVVGGLLALWQAQLLKRDLSVLLIAGAGFIGTQLILAGFEPYGRYRAGLDLVPAIQAELTPSTKIYAVGMYEQSLSFYLRRTITLVDYEDEFAFGLAQQPELALPTVDAFVLQWQRDAAAGVHDLALIRDDIYASLRQRGVPMRIVVQDARRIIIANQPQP